MAERRQLTVLFCDVVGSTHLARTLGPEDWHALVNRIHSQFGEVIAARHGHVAQYLGDGLLAYFGYPAAAQDDARRAVAAALELVREAGLIETADGKGIRIRVGLHTGSVVVGNVGSSRHHESLALGDAPNLAARIQEWAPANGVVVSRETHHLVERFFVSSELGAFVPKGFTDPVTLFRVLGESGVRTPLEAASVGGLTPLVGRASEIATMVDVWDRARTQGRAMLLLLGEGGIGKSRLVHALKGRLEPQGVQIHELRCSEHASNTAFYPLLEGLQRHAGARPDDPPAVVSEKLSASMRGTALSVAQVALVASLFGVVLPPEHAPAPQAQHGALVEALSAWVQSMHGERPALLVVEDLHWADPSTLEVIAGLMGRSSSGPMLTTLTARPEFAPAWSKDDRITTISPSRLQVEETRQVISLVAGGSSMPGEIVDRIVARADGIPLFLEEMTKAILESGVLRPTESGYQLDAPVRDSSIPVTLHDSLMGRLDQLGINKPIAQLASVFGRKFTMGLLQSVWRRLPSLPAVDLTKGLDRIVASQLMTRREEPEPTYQFKHSLVQEAAYQSLLRSARKEYHLQTAVALCEDFAAQTALQPESVAHHYAAAQMNAEALDYWAKAGQHAIGTASYAEAIHHFGSGLEHLSALPHTPQRSRREIELRALLGLALITTRGYAAPEVEATFSRAAILCDELGAELPSRILYGTWVVNFVRGDLASTRVMVPNLEHLAGAPNDKATVLVALASLVSWSFWRGAYDKLDAYHSLADTLYDHAAPRQQHEALLKEHNFEGLLYPKLYFAWSRAIVGEPQRALSAWSEAAAYAERIGDPYMTAEVLAFGAAIDHDLGNFVAEGELADKVSAIASEKGFVFWLAIALGHKGLAMVADGNPEAGIPKIKECLQIFKMSGVKTTYSYYLCYLAQAYLATGHVEDAMEVATQALEMTRSSVDNNYEPEMLRLLGEAHLAQDNLSSARTSLQTAIEISRSQGARLFELQAATSLARVLRAEGEGTRARDVLRTARAAFTAVDLPIIRLADALLREL